MLETLETKRLILRSFKEGDEESIFLWASDSKVSEYLTWKPHKDIEETKKILSYWLEEYSKKETVRFAITLKENNLLIGGIDVVKIISGTPVIGYNLNRNYWNKGYMSEALSSMKSFLFKKGYKTLILEAFQPNIPSNKVILKNGGELVGTHPLYCPSKDKILEVNSYLIKESPKEEMLNRVEELHTTPMGYIRINSIFQKDDECISYIKEILKDPSTDVIRLGKNYYLYCKDYIVTINASSFTIITARNR